MPSTLTSFCAVLVALMPALPGAWGAGARLAHAGDPLLAAELDYSVPPRFRVPELPEPGSQAPGTGQATRYFDGPVRPVSWRVDLDGCGSTGAITSYRWELDGELLATSATCDGVHFDAPVEGTYEVELSVADAGGGTASVVRDVHVQNWLIFGLGDSYGSGEGVPDVPVTGAQLDAVAAARDALDDAEIEVAARLADLSAAEDALAAIEPLLDAAADRYAEWVDAVEAAEDACDDFPPNVAECAAAQADVVDALAALGDALTDLDLEDLLGTSGVPDALDELRDAAEQTVADAGAALDDAQQAAGAAADALDDALADVGPRWLDRQCHRSQHAGQVEAARILEDSDPRTSVTFLHLACSGALISRGMLAPYEGQEPAEGAPRGAQVDEAAALSAGREVDGLIVSIGGNDVRFSAIVEACIVQDECFEPLPAADADVDEQLDEVCSGLGPLAFLCEAYLDQIEVPAESAQTIFLGNGSDCAGRPGDDADVVGLDDLPCNYDDLDERVATFAAAGLDGVIEEDGRARLYLTAYPALSRDDAGGLCGFDPSDAAAERMRNLPGVSSEEMLWAEEFVAAMLADSMRDSSAVHGWRFVEDHVAAFDGHGYCANDNWIVRIQESVEVQGRIDPIESSYVGSVHPNADGNAEYGRATAAALLCDFYPDCDPTLPPRGSAETGMGTTSTTSTTMGVDPVCGDASGDGSITASDALQVLRFAVGLGSCALCLCDVDTNGTVTASDALAVLRRVVDDTVILACSAC